MIALCIFSVAAIHAENSERQNAENYLKNSLLSPSSYKLVKVKSRHQETTVLYDTLYHIEKVYAHTNYGIKDIDSVSIDSIQIMKESYPACNVYHFEYDASNRYGAILRGNDDVWVCNGKCYFADEYIEKYMNNQVLDHKEALRLLIVVSYGAYDYKLKDDKWVEKDDFGFDYDIHKRSELNPAEDNTDTQNHE